ncbi:FAD-dependent monooxygenase [Nocardia mexicana]|uniref:2-polyprenyl-6-methoxyphenol hydroxylase-like FAD-dependent oxidoreductase n=1 Tax=Nocardia mexicana TaxID=279262 RepID=A0A370HA75_9NOCA|nr:FAD-dependent monooxygenase [Nocardia mexicana]RDI52924.1 2-polyprenyl-6-methoxyphenol hydroxylase-like FAD-dependent oxidoreductase [Nocardia mexicana]
MRNTTVLVSGAGIAGPSLAYWLDRYGFDVTVVERAPALRPGGQAVDFKGRTHRTVLERMEILAEVERRQTGRTDMLYVDAEGRELACMSGEFTGGDVEILRGDLAEILYERTSGTCDYLFGDSIAALAETADGIRVEFERAPARNFDLVFGADGIHSRVRRLAFGPERDYVEFLGYYYCLAGATANNGHTVERERSIAHAFSTPGRVAVDGGSKAPQMYMFASPELGYARDDIAAQQRIVADTFAGVGGRVPRMLAELPGLDGFYMDSLSRVKMMDGYTRGRVALVGDAAYGNTLGGFGTGLAVVGAYVLAGELAAAAGDHTVAFARYDEIMRRYAKDAGKTTPGSFLAPKTALGIRARNWFLRSRMFGVMTKMGDKISNDIDLKEYEAAAVTVE